MGPYKHLTIRTGLLVSGSYDHDTMHQLATSLPYVIAVGDPSSSSWVAPCGTHSQTLNDFSQKLPIKGG